MVDSTGQSVPQQQQHLMVDTSGQQVQQPQVSIFIHASL